MALLKYIYKFAVGIICLIVFPVGLGSGIIFSLRYFLVIPYTEGSNIIFTADTPIIENKILDNGTDEEIQNFNKQYEDNLAAKNSIDTVIFITNFVTFVIMMFAIQAGLVVLGKLKIFSLTVKKHKLNTLSINSNVVSTFNIANNSTIKMQGFSEVIKTSSNYEIDLPEVLGNLQNKYNKTKTTDKILKTTLYTGLGIFFSLLIINFSLFFINNYWPSELLKNSINFFFPVIFTIFSFTGPFISLFFLINIFNKLNTKTEKIKSNIFEFFRRRHNIFKLIYLNSSQVNLLKEANLISNIFYNLTSIKCTIVEGILIQLEGTSRPLIAIELLYKYGDSSNSKSKSILVFCSQNPDEHFGNTVAYSGEFWNFEFGEKVKTESIVFDKIFQTYSQNQLEARMALQTNTMQDMIDLAKHRPKSLFYFQDNNFMVFLNYDNNPFEIDGELSFKNPDSSLKNINKDLNLVLNIYKNFWINRKSWKQK